MEAVSRGAGHLRSVPEPWRCLSRPESGIVKRGVTTQSFGFRGCPRTFPEL